LLRDPLKVDVTFVGPVGVGDVVGLGSGVGVDVTVGVGEAVVGAGDGEAVVGVGEGDAVGGEDESGAVDERNTESARFQCVARYEPDAGVTLK
jgi:hypothetical protein